MSRKIKVGGWHLHLPRSQWARIVVGVLLILGGMLGFLPVLGFWMIPLGLMVLSVDLPVVRRWRRQLTVWWHNGAERQDIKEQRSNGKPGS